MIYHNMVVVLLVYLCFQLSVPELDALFQGGRPGNIEINNTISGTIFKLCNLINLGLSVSKLFLSSLVCFAIDYFFFLFKFLF